MSGILDVAALPISMVRYGAFLAMMGRNPDEPWGWNCQLTGKRPAGIVVVSSVKELSRFPSASCAKTKLVENS